MIDNSLGKVAGVVIASHGAGRGDMQAYISPMEVIMDDVKAVMGADHVRLPACSPGIIKNVQKNAGKSVDVIADLETKVERTMSQEKGNCELGNPRKVDVISWSMAIKEVKKVEVEVRDELFCV